MSLSRTIFITTFGLGHCRPAPGTWGSLPPCVMVLGLIAAGYTPHSHPEVYFGALAAVLLAFSVACVAQGKAAEAQFGRKDPSQAVADETAGQCLPLMVLPASASAGVGSAWLSVLVAFLLFRVCDILKPPPANQLQALPAGWGILVDDLVAGGYAALVMWGLVALGAL